MSLSETNTSQLTVDIGEAVNQLTSEPVDQWTSWPMNQLTSELLISTPGRGFTGIIILDYYITTLSYYKILILDY